MVSNRLAAKARAYMAVHPGIRYQQALEALNSLRYLSRPLPGRPAELPPWLKTLGVADINTHDFVKVWAASSKTNSLRIPIGYLCNDPDPDGQRIMHTGTTEVAHLDIAEARAGGSGPHGVLQGMTGAGVVFLVRGFVGALAALHGPGKLRFLLLDAEDETVFHRFSGLPHTIGSYSRLRDNRDVLDEICQRIEAEIARRRALLARFNVEDAFGYRRLRAGNPQLPEMPALVIVAKNLLDRNVLEPEYAKVFDTVLRVGRATGIHLVMVNMGHLAAVPVDWAKSWTFGISLRTTSDGWSQAVVGDDSAEIIPFEVGRLRGDGSGVVRTFVEFDVEEAVGGEPTAERDQVPAKAIDRLVDRMAG